MLYFDAVDLERRVADLRSAGVSFTSEPGRHHVDSDGTFGEAGAEEWMAFFTDPDGNPLALVERRAPPAG